MIPFNSPFIVGKELFYIAQAVLQHQQLAGGGTFGKKCQSWLEQTLSCKKVLLTHSCTGALEMSAILCDIAPGDEVIMPSFTFVSTANAFVLRGGIPVFVDIKKGSLNIDEDVIESAITTRTKVIVAVHYAGVPCNMEVIMDIAAKYNLLVVEDAAQALGSKFKNDCLGTIGHLGTLSFHETKNIISGEGGALLINDPDLIERAEIIWEKGTNRQAFFQGNVDKYTWNDLGSSFQTSELVAAFLYAQLEHSHLIIKKRNDICNLYRKLLSPLEIKQLISLPGLNIDGEGNGHIFYLLTKDSIERNSLITHLNNKNILAIFHYIPLHSSPAGKKFGKYHNKMTNTNSLSERILRLPLFYEMTENQVSYVVQEIFSFYKSARSK